MNRTEANPMRARAMATFLTLAAATVASARADRLDAVLAERTPITFEDIPIAIPLAPADGNRHDAWVPRRPFAATTIDGQTLNAQYAFIARVPANPVFDGHDHEEHDESPPPARGWLNEAASFAVVTLDERNAERSVDALAAQSAPGLWVMQITPPPGVTLGAIVIDGQRLEMRAMQRDAYVPRREIVDPTGADWSRLREFVGPMLLDPDERWRLRLLEDRVAPATVWGDAGNPARTIPDAMLEARATQIEQRWRAALAIIHSHDEQTAIDLVRALTSVVRLPSGVVVPAWPVENDDHTQLLGAILEPGIKASDAARRARGYINSIAGACLTVLDDNQGILALTEVRGQTLDAIVAGRRVRLAPFQTDISVIPESGDGSGLAAAEVRAGPMRSSAAALNGAVPVRPPGYRLGPMLEAWTLADWRSARQIPATGERACAALVQRGPMGAGEDVGGAAWQVYVECAAAHSGPPAGDSVVLYFGDIVRTVDSGGTIRDGDGEEVARFPTMFDHGRWWAIVPVPGEAIGPDETLLIAMERRDDSGWRATWPRPLLPGDARPAPIRLDLRAWAGGIARP
ncbi:MAG: hypothetical protein R3B46_04770 [Phycisphaerales bacterium]